MSLFNDRIDEEYNKSVEFVLCYAESLGAEYVCTNIEQFTAVSGGETIREKLEFKIYRFGDEYFRVEKMCFKGKPWMGFSFSDSVEGPYEDEDPFPVDLSEEELKEEVRLALRIE
ncbi:MAG: hypothetical protein J5476_08310 [Lachnospiraceae bacterium]|nr:hypothetical protein [Lachnospiraceae bacterium]